VEIQSDLPTDSVKTEINSFKSIIQAKFDSVDARFESVDIRFDLLEKRFDLLEKRFDSLIKWLKIGTTTGIGIILTMGGWLITSIIAGGF